MAEKNRWADMYRAHTCFKALSLVDERVRDGEKLEVVRIDNDKRPCRQCRAWWRRGTEVMGVEAVFKFGRKTWRSSGAG